MTITNKLRCKGSFTGHTKYYAKRVIDSFSPEQKKHLAEVIQAKVCLEGEPKNKEVYEFIVGQLRGENNG